MAGYSHLFGWDAEQPEEAWSKKRLEQSTNYAMAKTAYVISNRIAQGGMAEIYLGKAVGDDAFQRIVAIKRILPHYAKDKDFVAMFRDEAHICKRLQHANIVQVYDFTEVDNSYAIIMEHVDGADFRSLLAACENANRRLSVPMVLFIVAAAARGLHYAHTKTDEITHKALGIVHRDISPQNILISFEGEVKITDFGIASAEDKVTETRPGVVKGKYSYMSPEQVAAKHLDGRTDIFSLGIVLWEALTMRRLFAGKTEVETIRRVQNCEVPDTLMSLNSEVTKELADIVHQGLAKDTKDRFQTGAEFEKALQRYLNSTYPEFVPTQLGEFLKNILSEKFDESRAAQKRTLTSVEQPVARFDSSVSGHVKSLKRERDELVLEETSSKIVPTLNMASGQTSIGMQQHPRMGSNPNHTKSNKQKSQLKLIDASVHIRPALKKVSKVRQVLVPSLFLVLIIGIAFVNRERLKFELSRISFFSNTVDLKVTADTKLVVEIEGFPIKRVPAMFESIPATASLDVMIWMEGRPNEKRRCKDLDFSDKYDNYVLHIKTTRGRITCALKHL